MQWNFADTWDAVAAAVPDRAAVVHGERRVSWAEFERRSAALAAALLDAGLGRQAKVGTYLYSRPEYLETYYAAFKASLVPFNVNYRYKADEVLYIFDNADAEAVVFGASFTPLLEEIRDRLPAVRLWICVPEAGHDVPSWATSYDDVASSGRRPEQAVERGGDDIFFLYTGGTTGMPKAVMWRQDDVAQLMGGGGNAFLGETPAESLDEVRERVRGREVPQVHVPACPLMHGTGLFTCYQTFLLGGTVALLTSTSFKAQELLDVTQRERATSWAIVGDPFARPVLEALDAQPGHWDISSLLVVGSSGAMWSEPIKRGLLKHHPGMILVDAFSSSEAVSMGASISTGGDAAQTAKFTANPRTRVLRPDGTPVEPGSGEVGVVAVDSFLPLGYYKDPEKTGRTIVQYGDKRYVLSGDMATVDAEGQINVLGRGSVCINTGGEKVFPEEVEEVLKEVPGVRDALCIGVPDQRWGEAVTAVVEAEGDVDPAEVIAHVKSRLADYKAPKHVLLGPVGRSPSGKADYAATKKWAVDQLSTSS
ncbi:MAG TPA: AMP-binding protein [Mycobacteriales bacterium]|jgi:acyl-CoA synthetase (AMP-forming)/AMP-acid ligase II|nr:AMP-binding protein [Mycobacteriales bacterium]